MRLIENSRLSKKVKKDASAILKKIAEVEAKIHNTTTDKIHFHEVGAVDSIIDIVGTAIAIELLAIEKFYSSPVPLGSGMVESSHGILPIPAPATIKLLEGVNVYQSNQQRELVTPTGAAILTYYCSDFSGMPLMRTINVGYGVGEREDEGLPNLLRLVIGQMDETYLQETMEVIETNIDDMNPEFYDIIFDKLFHAGALDVFLTPIQMKKNRPANVLTVLANPEDKQKLISILFDDTTTFGIRTYTTNKTFLQRKTIEVKTKYGKVKVKIGMSGKKVKSVAPEYESCRKIAAEKNIPIKQIYAEASRLAQKI